MTQLFSTKDRPVHLGPFPLENLMRGVMPEMDSVPPFQPLNFRRPDMPSSIVNAMGEYQAMMDAIRDGLVNKSQAGCPEDPLERANHIKAFGYFADAAMVGVGPLPQKALLKSPYRNPDIDRLAHDLRTRQTKTLAAGIDLIMADLKEAMNAPPTTIGDHKHAIVFLYDMPRDPAPGEEGCEWLEDAQQHRACLRATETAVVIANYIRLLGWDAKAHSATSSDVDLNMATVAAGLASVQGGRLANPYLGDRFGVAVVTTDFDLAHDLPLLPVEQQPTLQIKGPRWWLGKGSRRSALNGDPFAKRAFKDGPHPFETLKRVEDPTTYIDEARVARVPKRADMFARAQFGDMGKPNQAAATGGFYVRKAAPSNGTAADAGGLCVVAGRGAEQRSPSDRCTAQCR